MWVEGFVRKVVGRHDRAADESLEGESGQHIQTKAAGFLSANLALIRNKIMMAVPYNRAMLTMILFDGKLLSTFPCVFEPKDRNPAIPIARHMISDTPVE